MRPYKLLFCSAVSTLFSGCSNQPSQKNIIVIYLDDLRFDALGCTGNAVIKTPHIDSLASKGMRFTNAYVTTSISSPSRAAMLTGMYGSRNGVLDLSSTELNDPKNTISNALKNAGYSTAIIGKWHLGNSPAICGFDYSVYFEGNGDYYSRTIIRNGHEEHSTQFIEDFSVTEAIRFIEKQSKPYFLFLCSQLPHMDQKYRWNVANQYKDSSIFLPCNRNDDLQSKPSYLTTGRHKMQGNLYGYQNDDSLAHHIRNYYSAVTALDRSLGVLFQFLNSTKAFENTVVIIMSDNGWFIGEHGFTSKVLAYEESVRVPLIVAGNGITRGIRNEVVLNIDLAPTISELCGIPATTNFDGISFLPLLQNKSVNDWRKVFIYEAPKPELGSYPLYAYISPERKYIRTYDINKRDSVIFHEEYDLINDKAEMRNTYNVNSVFTGMTDSIFINHCNK